MVHYSRSGAGDMKASAEHPGVEVMTTPNKNIFLLKILAQNQVTHNPGMQHSKPGRTDTRVS